MQDIITREITVKATQEKVYGAITDPAQMITWFPDVIEEGTLEVGQTPVFVFTGENHRARIYVEASTPFNYFAYRWVPGGAGFEGDVLSVANTLVEFFIEEAGDETRVTLKESGFASLPADIAEQRLQENNGGWDIMMDLLQKKLNQG